jgi:hypothetical protein
VEIGPPSGDAVADAAAMTAARSSPQGQQASADIANYATGGAVVIHYPVRNGTC